MDLEAISVIKQEILVEKNIKLEVFVMIIPALCLGIWFQLKRIIEIGGRI